MKKIPCALLMILAILAFTGSAVAEVWFGGDLPFAMSNHNLDNGLGFQGRLQVPVNKVLIVEAAVGSYSTNTAVDVFSEGDYSLTWISASLILEAKSGPIRPFGGIGLAHCMPSHDVSDRVRQLVRDLNVRLSEDVNSGAGLMAKGGLAIPLSPAALIQVGVNYLYFEPKADFQAELLDTGEKAFYNDRIKLSTFLISFGIAFNPFARAENLGN